MRIVNVLSMLCLSVLVMGAGLDANAADALPATLFVKEAPAAPVNVAELKKTAKEGDEVTLRGQIGGQAKDVFNAGRAMMMVADMKLISCDKKPDENCPTPWDFCCTAAAEKKASIAIVQVADGQGKTIKTTLKGANGLDHLSIVVVKGKVVSAVAGNLIVNATSIYLEPAVAKK